MRGGPAEGKKKAGMARAPSSANQRDLRAADSMGNDGSSEERHVLELHTDHHLVVRGKAPEGRRIRLASANIGNARVRVTARLTTPWTRLGCHRRAASAKAYRRTCSDARRPASAGESLEGAGEFYSDPVNFRRAPVVAWITAQYGWRASFLATGAVGFLLIPPWHILHRALDGTTRPEARKNEVSGPRTPLAFVLQTRKYWCTLAARSCSDAAWYFYLFWMPGYFQEARALSLETVGSVLWIPYFAAGVGSVGGSWLSSALMHRGVSLDRARKSVLIPSRVLGSLGALSYFAEDYLKAIGIVAIALLGHQSWSSNLHTAISEIPRPSTWQFFTG